MSKFMGTKEVVETENKIGKSYEALDGILLNVMCGCFVLGVVLAGIIVLFFDDGDVPVLCIIDLVLIFTALGLGFGGSDAIKDALIKLKYPNAVVTCGMASEDGAMQIYKICRDNKTTCCILLC